MTEPVIAEAVPEAVAVMAEEAEAEPVTEPVTAEVVPEAVAVMVEEAEPEPVTEPAIAEVVPEAAAVMVAEAGAGAGDGTRDCRDRARDCGMCCSGA